MSVSGSHRRMEEWEGAGCWAQDRPLNWRDEPPRISVDDPVAEAAKASYARCCDNDDFFPAFYRRFFEACPPAEALFAGTDFTRQHKLLRHAIGTLLIFGHQPDAEPNLLTRIAVRHSRAELGVKPEWYALFLDSLIDTVASCDPEFGPELEGAWRATTAKGIAYMQSRY